MKSINELPFFSVIIPTFNRYEILQNAISSVINQTFENFELVIVDNGSTDNTSDLINKFSDSRIIYKYIDPSGSPAKPRNEGIKISKGRWICFLDSDDFWYETKLSIVYENIQKNLDFDVFYHNEHLVNKFANNRKIVLEHTKKIQKDFYRHLLEEGNTLSTSAVIINNKFLRNLNVFFNEDDKFRIVEDYDFWLKLASKGAKFYPIEKELGVYIVDGNNLISNWKMYLNNLSHLLFTHIYEIQEFRDDKDFFWLQKKVFIRILRAKYLLRELNLKKAFLEIAIILFKYPGITISHILKKIKYKFYV